MPWLASGAAALVAWHLAGLPWAGPGWLWPLGLAGLWLVARGPAPSPDVAIALGSLALLAIGAGIGRAAIGNASLLRGIAASWLAVAILSSLIGLAQYFGFAHHLAPWVNITEAGEAFGNLRQRNQFATLVSMGLLSLLWMIRTAAQRYEAPAAAIAILLGMASAASTSRTGAIQLLLVIGLMAWWSPAHRTRMVHVGAACVLAYLVSAAGLPWVAQSLMGFSGGSLFFRIGHGVTCDSRIVLWSNVMELIAQRPWLGWGWGELDYAHYIHPYGGPRFCEILDNAHDMPLQLAVELGLPFAVLVCGALVWAAVRGQPLRETDAVRQLGWGVLAIIMLHSLLEYPLWYGPFQIAFGIAAGMVMQAPRVKGGWRWGRAAAQLTGAAAMVLCCYAVWDYQRVSQIYMAPDARSGMFEEDTLGQIRRSWLFRNQARFAELTITAPSPANAQQLHAMATELVHYSPEPRVIERLIESAVLLGLDDEARLHLARYKAAFPKDYQRWTEGNKLAATPVSD